MRQFSWWQQVTPVNIPHICQWHQWQCQCQNFSLVSKYPDAKNVYFTCISLKLKLWVLSIIEHRKSTFASCNTTTTTFRNLPISLLYSIDNSIHIVLSRFTRFWCQIFELEMVPVSKSRGGTNRKKINFLMFPK